MAEAWAGSKKVTLFRRETPGGITYRIPALLFLPNESVFLAFAEKRSSTKDEDAMFLVMRRGKKEGTSVQWGPPEALMTAILPGHRTMNPCPVYEKKSGRVFLFFICVQKHVTEGYQIRSGRNAARLGYVSSRDGGHTWGQLTDLTDEVIGDDLRNWATFAVGPGHGLQMSSGRLAIPAYAYYIHKNFLGLSTSTRPHSFIFYSDDYGLSWSKGQLLRNLNSSECQVAEVNLQDKGHVLYCNARSPDKYRAEAYSMDRGVYFEESFPFKELPETGTGCQGSVVSFTPRLQPSELDRRENIVEPAHLPVIRHLASLKSSNSWMVFSHPASRDKRMDLGIYLNTSPLAKGGWKAPWVLHKGPSGYSDLAVCEEGQSLLLGCLFECREFRESEGIAFQLFPDTELLRNLREEEPSVPVPSEEHRL